MGLPTLRHGAPRLATALALGAVSACQFQALQFTNDHRLGFTAPKARTRVAAPLTVRWSMSDFTPVGLDGRSDTTDGAFVVFVDQAPMPVGKDLRWLFRSDKGCQRDARCPDQNQLRDRSIFVTTQTSVTIPRLPAAPRGRGDEEHFVNIVLVDGRGRRLGESAWYLPFTSTRRD
jgi:hypothetical protein